MAAIKRTFTTTLATAKEGMVCYFDLPFDPKEVFGKVRAPVLVHLPKHTFRSTVAAMNGHVCIGIRRSHREAAGLEGGETIDVTLELDTEVRDVEPPADLVKALKAAKALDGWNALSFTHKREHAEAIEDAKKPETRERRIAAAVAMIAEKAKPTKAKAKPTKPKAKAKPTKAKANAKKRGR